MAIRTVPGTAVEYYLVSVDSNGAERRDDPDGSMTTRLADALERQPITDVFLISHGWMGDIPAAIRQYDRWLAAMSTCSADVERAKNVRAGFKPLLVGFHWPSLPFGDEEIASSSDVSFSTPGAIPIAAPDTRSLIDAYAGRIADTPAARDALATIFAAAAGDTAPPELPADVVDACNVLNRESGLGAAGPGSAPGADREPYDPAATYQSVLEADDVSFGAFGFGPIVAVLQLLSFFKMKDRARTIGETSVHPLLTHLQAAAKQTGRDVRFHLMGHSFGCIVQSAALAGPPGRTTADPVHSAFLAQGAVSFWSYCSEIPFAKGTPGYFRSIIDAQRVTGAIVTTQSEHDTAVGRQYPLAVGVRGDVAFGPEGFPKYGALGAFGARGPGLNAVDLEMLETNQRYDFEPGRLYNVESSQYICTMQSRGSGAHNDIAHPQVAHAMWSAVLM